MRISVIVPVYNVEAYLKRCVDSILAQTFADFELILVDDGSPDNCGKICDAYAEKDNRVYVIHKENGGLSDARNAGLDWIFENSDSQWISFIDSDDWVHPKYLELLYEAVTKGNVTISACKEIHVHSESNMLNIENDYEWKLVDPESAHTTNNMVTAWGKLFAKELFRNLRFPKGKLHEDLYTTYKIVLPQEKVAVSPQEYYFYYVNPNSLTHVEWNPKRLDELEACEQILDYCIAHNRESFYKRMLDYYISCIVLNHMQAIEEKKEFNSYYSKLRRKLRKALRLYRKKCSRKIKGHQWMYLYAYPAIGKTVLWIKAKVR